MESPIIRKGYGGSLPVPNVQHLAASSLHLKNIPDKYIRPELAADEVSVDDSVSVPVIDMSMLSPDHRGYEFEMQKLHHACKYWGFFQLINHGVSEEATAKMKIDTQEFFNLPLEEKKKYAQLPNSTEGYGQSFVKSEDQKLDWADMLYLYALPVSHRTNKLWPTVPATFRSAIDEYSAEMQAVNMRLLKLMAINLGINVESFIKKYEDGNQGIRMNYYPPCLQANKVVGLTKHSDASALTLLIQVDDVVGLQIRHKGKWVPISPLPGAIIVNIGDTLEIMTNGEYTSIEHRAMVNPERMRLSIATFHDPNIRTKIGPITELIKEDGAKYDTVDHEDFLRMLFASKLDGKSLVHRMKINN